MNYLHTSAGPVVSTFCLSPLMLFMGGSERIYGHRFALAILSGDRNDKHDRQNAARSNVIGCIQEWPEIETAIQAFVIERHQGKLIIHSFTVDIADTVPK